jgi:hypothetical protein
LQKAAEHEGLNADEDVDLDLLVGPMTLGAQTDVVGIFHAGEGVLDRMLASVRDSGHMVVIAVPR